MKQRILVPIVATMAVLAACGTPSSTPTSTAPRPTVAAAPTSLPTTAPAAQPTVSGQSVRLNVDQHNSQATYRAREQLLGHSLPSDAIGTTKQVSGAIVLGPGGEPIAEQSNITVDLSSLQSDERRRDNFIKSDTLQTNRFPTAIFVPRELQGLPTPLPTSGQATFQMSGDLTVHGVTRPVTWQVTANFDAQSISGNATTQVQISDFGMTPPKAGPVLSIEDQIGLELSFSAAREG